MNMHNEKWLIIVNPNAGARKGAKDWPEISQYLNKADLSHICVLTEHRDHANRITIEFIEKGYRNIAMVSFRSKWCLLQILLWV
jgi:diacylglycerol kinase family enzyme